MKILKYACQELELPYQVVHDHALKGRITTLKLGKYRMVDPDKLKQEMSQLGYITRKGKTNEMH